MSLTADGQIVHRVLIATCYNNSRIAGVGGLCRCKRTRPHSDSNPIDQRSAFTIHSWTKFRIFSFSGFADKLRNHSFERGESMAEFYDWTWGMRAIDEEKKRNADAERKVEAPARTTPRQLAQQLADDFMNTEFVDADAQRWLVEEVSSAIADAEERAKR
jgi:hypothetical protein